MHSKPDNPLDDPIQDFSTCHVGIVKALRDLGALSRQQGMVPGTREAASYILTFFHDVVAAHHNEEESELFPAVLEDATAGEEHAKVQAITSRLVDEHRRVEARFAEIAAILSNIASGGKARLDESMVDSFVNDYIAHAQFEEAVFLPLSQAILGRNGDHMAALGMSLHMRHDAEEVRQRYGFL
jgi:hypothetical protein